MKKATLRKFKDCASAWRDCATPKSLHQQSLRSPTGYYTRRNTCDGYVPLRKTFVHHSVGSDCNVIANPNRSKEFCAGTDVAVVADAGSRAILTCGGTNIHADVKPAVCANAGARIDHDRPMMRDSKPWAEHVNRDRESQADAKPVQAECSQPAPDRPFSAIGQVLDVTKKPLIPPDVVVDECRKRPFASKGEAVRLKKLPVGFVGSDQRTFRV